MKILVATTNPGKLKEISEMLDFDIEWKSLADFPDIKEVEEDGKTFAENAQKKALGYAKQTGLWTLADDSGLVVDALGGLPGVNSARFSGQSRDNSHPSRDSNGAVVNRDLIDHKNMAKLLSLMENIPDEKRTARFACCLCLAAPDKILAETSGSLQGTIIRKEQGTNGFGYDPIFYIPGLKKTVAQLDSEQKNNISHRGRAIEKLKPILRQLIST
ncbi:MAG: dITP/XTP pyrophosphatase [Planctomycetes bacterium ADurb.Bin401]|nr:MAG: dITP/XTP pyrophosphatase [Planctomycetes bacterium ADurb.Bin401]